MQIRKAVAFSNETAAICMKSERQPLQAPCLCFRASKRALETKARRWYQTTISRPRVNSILGPVNEFSALEAFLLQIARLSGWWRRLRLVGIETEQWFIIGTANWIGKLGKFVWWNGNVYKEIFVRAFEVVHWLFSFKYFIIFSSILLINIVMYYKLVHNINSTDFFPERNYGGFVGF